MDVAQPAYHVNLRIVCQSWECLCHTCRGSRLLSVVQRRAPEHPQRSVSILAVAIFQCRQHRLYQFRRGEEQIVVSDTIGISQRLTHNLQSGVSHGTVTALHQFLRCLSEQFQVAYVGVEILQIGICCPRWVVVEAYSFSGVVEQGERFVCATSGQSVVDGGECLRVGPCDP